tara:strand:- start:2717 stop:5161 length:2445 start_codon:yes stop_codon:yes gene_type:complete
MRKIILLLLFINHLSSFSQEGILTGLILNEENIPVNNVNINYKNKGTISDANGFYNLRVNPNEKINIIFSHINHKKIQISVELSENEVLEFNPVLSTKYEQISEVVLNTTKRSELKSIINISPEKLRNIKGIQPGIENILKTLPGVSINNEMSSQYSVRGGNFDENLVYVNGIEIYRPFLIRSGQQEGLSFINSDMIKDIKFSAGGFEALYGDKISSVLDIIYKTPQTNKYLIKSSLLGGSLTAENISKNKSITNILGIRYRDNSLLVNSKETKTNFKPSFFDLQNYLSLNISSKFKISSILNFSVNKYNFKPINRQTNFGTLDDPLALIIFYDGEEKDRYSTLFNSISAEYKPNTRDIYLINTSFYTTNEKEYFDILAQYNLAEINTNIGSDDLGEVEFSQGVGSQLNHARNNLNAQIFNIESKIKLIRKKNEFNFGLKFSSENINDRIVEWEVIDSAGYLIDPPFLTNISEQPYEPNEGPIVPFQNIRSTSSTKINRVQLHAQWENESYLNDNKVYYNFGLRLHNWKINSGGNNFNNNKNNTVISPRLQIGFVPNWNSDMIFNIKYGIYYQPPFYKELRNYSGLINPLVKAQKSTHYVVSNEYKLNIWDRPFRLNSELYYKDLDDINPYTVNNVRIRYLAQNSAVGYAYGLDFRINGEFVKGTESWFSFGYLKTEENIENRGYISRPTDQRLKFGILFQDYVPNLPNLKMFINLIYNTGLPGGSPSYADSYDYQNRLPDYKRADIGISYSISETKKLFNIDELSVGLEIFNMFNIQNTITNTWVRDVYSKRQYSIPNYLTPRIFNLNLDLKF